MSRHEVTVRQFQQFVAVSRSKFEVYADSSKRRGMHMRLDGSGPGLVEGLCWFFPFKSNCPAAPNHPVVLVNWHDAEAYCKWAGVRLPTEAEWEYAARAGAEGRVFVWGDGPPKVRVGNFRDLTCHRLFPMSPVVFPGYDDGYVFSAPVGQYEPTGLGLFDMAGNVWEWCADWYGEQYYGQSPSRNPQGPDAGENKVVRGGAWHNPPDALRASFRYGDPLNYVSTDLGFRCVRSR